VIIRPILLDEIDTLRQLAIRTYSAAFASKNRPGVIEAYYASAFTVPKLTQELEDSNAHWYFASVNSDIVGYLKLNVDRSQTEFQEHDGIELERIYVDVGNLNKGYGEQLLNFAISKGRGLRKKYIWLGVWEENPDAIRFYKRHGFKITGTHDYNMTAEIQTDYIMRLDLL